MIEAKNLSYAYSKKGPKVLDDVSISLETGQIGILLGPNGVGKSTLIRCMAGLLKPRSGTISLDGEDLLKMKANTRALKIAYVPQKVSFSPLSVYDSIMVGRLPYFGLYPGKKDHEVVLTAIEEFGLTHLLARNVLELSGGEQQIVAICRAYVQGASAILFDEPTANLDIANRHLVLAQIRKLKEKGLTILISMHDINEALELGERFFFLKENRIPFQGGIEALTPVNIKEIFGVDGSIQLINGKRVFILGGNEHE